jgi:protein-L-isoaspartate O-methyltransferase
MRQSYEMLVDRVLREFEPRKFLKNTLAEVSEESFGDAAIRTFSDGQGLTLSAISDRRFLRWMIGALMPLEGKRIFEIGTGTGFVAQVLERLCEPGGTVFGCEIIPEIFHVSRDNLSCSPETKVELMFGDFVDVLPGHGKFDVIVGTSSFARLHSCIVEASCPDGGKIAIPIEIPGGGDCFTIFERSGYWLQTKVASLTVSVPTTGRYSEHCIWAPTVESVLPNFQLAPKTTIRVQAAVEDPIRDSLAFRSFLLFHEPLFQAVSLAPGVLRAHDMAFGLIHAATESCCLQHGQNLILAGPNALGLAGKLSQQRRRWEGDGRPSLADSIYKINLQAGVDFTFSPALKDKVIL